MKQAKIGSPKPLQQGSDFKRIPKEEREKMYDEIVDLLIRKKYSLSQELSLHRQQHKKPQEFAEYDLYAEECKKTAKEILLL